jgi:hypothetical protein
VRDAEAAHERADRQLAEAHRLDCLAWSVRLFIGGADQPSPSIADALHGGVPLLEVQRRHCNHGDIVDLALVIWPRSKVIHTIAPKLYCRKCHGDLWQRAPASVNNLRMRDERSGRTDPPGTGHGIGQWEGL